jgi:hypothetical protein
MDVLKAQSVILKDFEKGVMVCFDGMKVSSDLCFDQKEEVIRGPHTNVQVVLVRCIAGKWMQPVFYDFDTAMTTELLIIHSV